MADRYWVGGDGNWNQPELHWSDTSGGTPNAAFLPTSADNVVFDANSNIGTSAFTVCVDETAAANCQDFSTSSLDGAMTLLMNATSVLNCYGSMTLPATNFTLTGTIGSVINFSATTTGKTITTNGVSFGGTNLIFVGVGGEWTFGSAITCNNFIHTAGSVATANYALTVNGGFTSSGTTARSLSFGSSTYTNISTNPFTYAGSNLTFNAGTSTIVCSAAAPTFSGGGLTFHNVTFSGGAGTKTISGANTYTGQFLVSNAAATVITFGANQTFTGGALIQATALTVSGSGFTYTGTVEFASAAHGQKALVAGQTFQNLKITCPAVDGITLVSIGNITVTGTLTSTDGGSTARRIQIVGTSSVQRTLTVGTNSLVNTDFGFINAAGTASWTFGLGYGDLGNNSGITFDTSTLYWIGGTGNWSDGTKWSTSSGGSAANAVPCPQNSVIFDAASNTGTGAFTVTGNAAMQCKDFSTGGAGGALDGTMTFAGTGVNLFVYGNLTFPATNFTRTFTGNVVMSATSGSYTVTTNGISLASNTAGGTGLQFGNTASTATWTLGSALTISTGYVASVTGTFDTGNYDITAIQSVLFQGTLTKTVNFGSSTITSQGTATMLFGSAATTSNTTVNAGTSTLINSATSPTLCSGLTSGGVTFYNVSFTSTAAGGIVTITGANTFNNLTFTTPASAIRGITLGANQTVSGTLTLGAANTAIRRVQLQSDVIGTQRTITLNGTLATLTDVDFRDFNAAGTVATPWTGTRLGDGKNVSNVTTDTPKTVYWNLAGSQNWPATGWALTNNGTPSVNNFPLAQDTAVFTEAGAAGTVTINSQWWIGSIQMADGVSNRTTAFTLATGANNPQFYGSLTFFSNLTWSGTGTIFFYGQATTQTITSAGRTFTQPITINSPSGTVRIADNLTLGSTLTTTLTAGTLDLTNNGAGNYTLSTGLFSSSNSNTRSIAFGTGNITLTGNGGTIWNVGTATGFTYAGTPTVNCTYAGSTGTRTITHGGTSGGTEANAVSFNISAGSDTVSTTSSATNAYKNLNFTGFTGTYNPGSARIFGNLTLGSGSTFTTSANAISFIASSGTQTLTTNGVAIGVGIIVGALGTTNTLQLQDNCTTTSVTLTSGTLDLTKGGTANLTLSCGLFSSNATTVRSIAFGTGQINVTGNNTAIYNLGTLTGFTYTGTSKINATYSGAVGIRNIYHGTSAGTGASESTAVNINITAGTDIVDLVNTGNLFVRNLDFTGFAGKLVDIRYTIYGNLIFSSGMTLTPFDSVTTFAATSGTQQVTTNSKTLDFPITQNSPGATLQLQDNLTMGSTRTYTLTAGTLDLSSGNRTLSCGLFGSNNSNTRAIAFGTGNVTITGSNTEVLAFGIANNFTRTGTPTVNFTYAGSTGTRTISFGSTSGLTEANALDYNISAGSDTIAIAAGSGGGYRNLNYTGFTGIGGIGSIIYGNITLGSGMSINPGSVVLNFKATSGTQQITTNGVIFDRPITQDGVGGRVQFQDAFTMGATRAYTLVNGTLDFNNQTFSGPSAVTITGGTVELANGTLSIPITQTSGTTTLQSNIETTTYTLTAGTLNLNGYNLTATTQFSTNNSNVRSINFASTGKIVLSGSGTVWDASTATNLTTSGSGGVSLTSASAKTFAGGGASYRTISQDGTGTLTLTGANTFTTIANTVQPTTVTFPAGVTTSVVNFLLSGTSGNLVTINSSSPGTQFTLAQV